MALFARRVLDVVEATFFVAPLTAERRQLTVARITVARLGDQDEGVNILVVPVPRSVLREPCVLDARSHQSALSELYDALDEPAPLISEASPHTVAYRASSNRLRYCASVDELRHVRMDARPLNLPAGIVADAEREYSEGFGFWVLVWRLARPVTRLVLAYTHPLHRDALFVPLRTVAPRGVPFGERPSIAIDDAPQWARRTVAVFSCDTDADVGGRGATRPNTRFAPGRLGLEPLSVRCLAQRFDDHRPAADVWLPLSAAYAGLLAVRSCLDCGDLNGADAQLRRLLRSYPNAAVVLAHAGALHGARNAHSDAKACFAQAVAAEPSNPAPLVHFARYWETRGQPRKAEVAYRAALALDPHNAASLTALGVSLSTHHTSRAAMREAAEVLTRARAARRDNSAAESHLAALDAAAKQAGPSVGQLSAMREHEQAERRDVAEHLDAYLDNLYHESRRIFAHPDPQ